MRNKPWRILALTQSVHLLLLLVLDGVSSNSEFEISVPAHVQMAVYGEGVLLPCMFPVSSSWDADSSVITWQRNLEVVHSFFHGRDQPEYQSPRYANRTSLFHQEMKKGNASLRLERTTLEDVGEYTCSISTTMGSQRKSFGLRVAAFYPEPRIHISVLNDGHMELRVTSDGGYPSPLLQWLVGHASDITNDTHTQLRQDQHTHLYSMNSKLDVSGTVNYSITFIMKNPDLGQEIRRNIELFSEKGGFSKSEEQAEIIRYVLIIFLLIATIISVFVILLCWRMEKCNYSHCSESNTESSVASSYQRGVEKPSADAAALLKAPRREG